MHRTRLLLTNSFLCVEVFRGYAINVSCKVDLRELLFGTTTIVMSHRALGIDEILGEVAAWVVDTHTPTAVSLACCTKLFEEPALRALWNTPQELPSLIKVLPPDCWEVRPPNTPGGRPEIVCGSSQSRIFN